MRLARAKRSAGVALLAAALAAPGAALGEATVQSLRGEVQAGASAHTLIAARENQRLPAGRTVRTGAGAQAVLRFGDGQQVVLGEHTELRIVEWRFTSAARDDAALFDLARGTARFVTGTLAARSPSSWALRTPQGSVGVRGTEFLAAVGRRTYVRVLQGAVALSNAGGTTVLPAGATATVAHPKALAAAIPAAAVPATVAAAFGSLGATLGGTEGSTQVAGGAAEGAAPLPGQAAELPWGTAAVVGAAVAVGLAAAAATGGSRSAQHHAPAGP